MIGIGHRSAGAERIALTAGVIVLGQVLAVAAVRRPEFAVPAIALLLFVVAALATREPGRLWVLALPVLPLLDYPIASLMGVSAPVLRLGVIGLVTAMVLLSPPRGGTAVSSGDLVLVAFGAYLVSNAILAGHDEALYTASVTILPGLVAYFVLRSAFADRGVRAVWLWWSLLALGTLLSVLGLAEAITHGDLLPTSEEGLEVEGGFTRVNGPFGTSIEYAVSMVMLLAVVSLGWGGNAGEARAQRHAAAVIGVLCLGAIFFTYFRTAWLLALSLVVIWIARQGLAFALLGGLAGLLVAVLLIGVPPELPSSALVENRILQERNLTSRQDTYATALRAFTDHPVVGVGLGRFQEFQGEAGVGVDPLSTPHSAYLGALAELGLLGFTLLAATLWRVVRGTLLSWRTARAVHAPWDRLALGALGAGVVYLLFGVDFEVLEVPFASLLFLSLAGAVAGLRAQAEAMPSVPPAARMTEAAPPAVLP